MKKIWQWLFRKHFREGFDFGMAMEKKLVDNFGNKIATSYENTKQEIIKKGKKHGKIRKQSKSKKRGRKNRNKASHNRSSKR